MNRSKDYLNFWGNYFLFFTKEQIKTLLDISKEQERHTGENGFAFKFEKDNDSDLSFKSLYLINKLTENDRRNPVNDNAVQVGYLQEYTSPIGGKPVVKIPELDNITFDTFFDVVFFPEDQIEFLFNRIKETSEGGICFYGLASAFKFLSERKGYLDFNILAVAIEDISKPAGVKGEYSFKFGSPCPPLWPPVGMGN